MFPFNISYISGNTPTDGNQASFSPYFTLTTTTPAKPSRKGAVELALAPQMPRRAAPERSLSAWKSARSRGICFVLELCIYLPDSPRKAGGGTEPGAFNSQRAPSTHHLPLATSPGSTLMLSSGSKEAGEGGGCPLGRAPQVSLHGPPQSLGRALRLL